MHRMPSRIVALLWPETSNRTLLLHQLSHLKLSEAPYTLHVALCGEVVEVIHLSQNLTLQLA